MNVITLKKGLRRVPFVILLGLITIIFSTPSTIFTESPAVTAVWQVSSPAHFHLGDVIKATLRLTAQPGVWLNTSQLPDAGDVLPLPEKIIDVASSGYENFPVTSPEGELEVVSRRIRVHSEGGLVVTEIDYEFLYLLPIDLSVPIDDKQLPYYAHVSKEFLQLYPSSGRTEWRSLLIIVDPTDFYIAPRLDENSVPIFKLFQPTLPASLWPKVKLAGFGLIGLAIAMLAWWAADFIKARARQKPVAAFNPPDANELFQAWCDNPNPATFVEAIKLYRRGTWGRTQASTWTKTTFVLYSGYRLDHDQMESIFAQIVKEVTHEPSA